jgi:eukaryotic-like serine/threonine-protein kinase
MGTPDYLAPEQAREPHQADIRADIYSLGCLLYHLLSGQPPFPDPSVLNQMIRHATETARPLGEFNVAVPDRLQQIVNGMMAKDPKQRYQIPEQVSKPLQSFLAPGAHPAVAMEVDRHWKTYLAWLESAGSVPDSPLSGSASKAISASAAPSAMTMPVTIPPFSPAVPPLATPRPAPKDARPRKQKKRQRGAVVHDPKPSPPLVCPPAPTARILDIDVDLVSLPQPSSASDTAHRAGPNRRDFVLFGMGALAGAAVTFLGCYLALKIGRNREGPAPQPVDR